MIKFRKDKGKTNIDCRKDIANDIRSELRKREIKGKIGVKHSFSTAKIKNWIEQSCINRGYLVKKDLENKWELKDFINTTYKTIMSQYIRKDTLIEDTDDPDEKISSDYYYPGLLHIMGKGWIITNSNELIEEYKYQRQSSLDGMKKHLGQKCIDSYNFVNLLPENRRDLLEEDKNVDVA